MSDDTVRINVLFPTEVAEELRHLVPPRRRSRFIVEVVETELRRLRQERVLQESAGAWHAGDHSNMEDGEAIDRWIAERRRELGWDDETEGGAGHARASA